MTQTPTEKWSVSMSDLKEFKRVMDEERRNRAAAILPEEPEKDYSGKWRNLWFNKKGESWIGTMVYETEKEAKERAIINIKLANASPYLGDNNPLSKMETWNDFSHVIQMPIGGDNQ